MIIGEGLPFIKDYVELLNDAIKQDSPEQKLSKIQCYWLSFVILGLIVTNSLCWARFERFSCGKYSAAAICWMFKKARITWELLLRASVSKLLERYGINSGVLVVDDTDSERSKNTTEIAKVHKIRDKKHAGFFSGQNIIFLLLVSDTLSIPVSFRFYEPDPDLSAWRKEDKRLRKLGVPKKHRPHMPERNPNYPTKISLAIDMLSDFKSDFNTIKIKATIADAFYGNKAFFDGALKATGQTQVLSQIKKTQLINVNGRFIQAQRFFENYQGKTEEVTLRFNKKKITYRAAKFKVKAHDKRLRVIALKYEGENEYRYLVANDTTWRDVDIIKAYSLRWLVEVFIQDWKSYEGWNQLAMQRGIDGSEHGLLISLLSDHALHFHQDQTDLHKNKGPAATVGSLREKVMMESLTAFIEAIVTSENPQEMFEKYSGKVSQLFQLKASIKHMRGADMGALEMVNA